MSEPAAELARKTFSEADQQRFAKLSGDCNPLHMDTLAARRTQLGRPIVHGVHGALWALEALLASETPSIATLQINFTGPIYLGETAVAANVRRADGKIRVSISVDGTAATSIIVTPGNRKDAAAVVNDMPASTADWPQQPLAVAAENVTEQAGALGISGFADAVASAFPALCTTISPERVAAIVSLSRLVGMVCPGLHSVFQGIDLDLVEVGERDVLRYVVEKFDSRFGLARMKVSGPGIEGSISAFLRPPPALQESMSALAALVPPGLFGDAQVLIVGGSRGLGEVAAKLCAAGGADVVITYASGRRDAEAVAAEIAGHGGRCSVLHYDACADPAAQLAVLPAKPTHLYYFATGPIAVRRTRFFSPAVIDEFLAIYVSGFFGIIDALKRPGHALRVFYPSSVAVEKAPKGWAEYAMAKAAGESLCRSLNQHLAGVEVICSRLPRLATDQTATLLPVQTQHVAQTLLAIILEVQS